MSEGGGVNRNLNIVPIFTGFFLLTPPLILCQYFSLLDVNNIAQI